MRAAWQFGHVGIMLAWLWLAPSAHAQEEPPRIIPFAGPEIVCHVLQSLDLTPIRTIRHAELDPEESFILLFGPSTLLETIDEATGGLAHYLEQGGNLVIASDGLLDRPDLGIHVSGARLVSNDSAYRSNPQCPFLKYPWLENRGYLEVPHPLFRFLNKGIATNCPSQVIPMGDRFPLHELLNIRSGTRDARRIRSTSRVYMVASGKDALPRGRGLFIAGQGMFMNGMMLQNDNDNFSFTVNMVEWLREGPDGSKRARALFVVDNEIITDFNANLRPSPPPIPMPTVTMMNRLLRGMEDENLFQRLLASLVDMDRMVAMLVALGTFGLLFYGAKKLVERRHFQDTKVPLLIGPSAAQNAMLSPIEQRQQDQVRRNDFHEAARSLVHAWLLEHFDLTPEEYRSLAGALQLQAKTASLHRPVALIMRLLRASKPFRVTQRELFWLVQSLPKLNRAIQENQLALLVEGKKVRQK